MTVKSHMWTCGGSGLCGTEGYAASCRGNGEVRGVRGHGFSYWLHLPHSCVPCISRVEPVWVLRVQVEVRGERLAGRRP